MPLHIPYLMDEVRDAARQAAREEIREAARADDPRQDVRDVEPEPVELRPAPTLGEQLNDLLMALPVGMKITIEQGRTTAEDADEIIERAVRRARDEVYGPADGEVGE